MERTARTSDRTLSHRGRSWKVAFATIAILCSVVSLDRGTTEVAAADGQSFNALTPARLLETRAGRSTVDTQANGTGAFSGSRELTVTGRGGVPASGVGAVAVNVTVTGAVGGGYTTVHPSGETRPNASNLNFDRGQTVANLVIAKVGANGRITFFNSAATHVVVDVLGWYPTGSGYSPLTPSRLTDTRPGRSTVDGQANGTGAFSGSRSLTVTGRGGVPASGVGAVALNVTITSPSATSFTTVHPAGEPRPNASNLNYTTGQTVANMVIAKVGSAGQITVYNSARADVVVDVLGWVPTGSDYGPLTPARLTDTRPGRTTVDGQANGTGSFIGARDLTVTGRGGVPASGVGAVVVNVTLTDTAAGGYTTVHPAGLTRPTASNVNFTTGQTVANLVIAKVGSDGAITIFNSARANVLVDVLGWFPGDPEVGAPPLPRVSAGGHTCALTDAGGARCWGANNSGQLGDGTTTSRRSPVAVSGLSSGLSAISVGGSHSCALTTSGGLRCWGSNFTRQLGDGTTTNRSTAITPTGLGSGVAMVSTGANHTCVVTTGGAARCWGLNDHGQLGDGTTTSRSTAITPTGLGSGVASISAGHSSTCAVTTSGAARCWGRNNSGQLGDGTTTNRSTPITPTGLGAGVASISAGRPHTCAVTTGGAARCWGVNDAGQLGDGTNTDRLAPVSVVGLGSGVASISAGNASTCAVTTSGAARCWGSNRFWGQVGDGTNTDRLAPVSVVGLGAGVRSISTGSAHACAQLVTGALRCWGDGAEGALGDGTTTFSASPVAVNGLDSGVADVSSGSHHSCAVTTTGGARCWGANEFGQLGDGTRTASSIPMTPSGLGSGVAAVSAGDDHTCAVTTSGAARCWGRNDSGQLGDGTDVDRTSPVTPTGLGSGVAAISAGFAHTCAVTTSGAARCWGSNRSGQLGDGTNTTRSSAVTPSGLTSGVTAISSGYDHTCALVVGNAKCWGQNGGGKLGDGTTTSRPVPTTVSGSLGMLSTVSIGWAWSCATTAPGGLLCWGSGHSTQPVAVTDVGSGVTRVSLSRAHLAPFGCAIASGAARCWGLVNISGQLGNGSTTASDTPVTVSGLGSGVARISAGGSHACSVTTAGAVRCWGARGPGGALGDGIAIRSNTPVAVVGF